MSQTHTFSGFSRIVRPPCRFATCWHVGRMVPAWFRLDVLCPTKNKKNSCAGLGRSTMGAILHVLWTNLDSNQSCVASTDMSYTGRCLGACVERSTLQTAHHVMQVAGQFQLHADHFLPREPANWHAPSPRLHGGHARQLAGRLSSLRLGLPWQG